MMLRLTSRGRLSSLVAVAVIVSAGCVLSGAKPGEELTSNPLRAYFNDLRTTQFLVDVA
jgi:hypothetical protein